MPRKSVTMDDYIASQIKNTLKCVPANLLKSVFIKKTSPEVERFKEKNGGFVRGVCHPGEDYSLLRDANIEWVRFDIPYPYSSEGELTESYKSFKTHAAGFKENGIKVMAVTPYPRSYIAAGTDIHDEKRIEEIAVFLLTDLQGIIDAVQITNEMGIPHFTIPLTMDEAARFIGIQAKAVEKVKGNILVGYNSAGPQPDLHVKLKPYFKYCDYVGIDFYAGCFANAPGYLWMFGALVRYLWAFSGKPVMLQEFGYISGGAPKTKDEKNAILRSYGVSSEEEAYAKTEDFIGRLPKTLCEHVRRVQPEVSKQGDFLFKTDLVNHLYRELPKITKIPSCPHTPEGQAKFFSKLIPRLYANGFLCGAFIYCFSDSDRCYICGQDDCPTETRWGLVTTDGKPKPSYNAVKAEFGKIRDRDSGKYKNKV